MTTYISLLRGINVAGKVIRMADLKTMYESLGFSDVTTYIQSGNVIFGSPGKNPDAIAGMIVEGVRKKFGFDVTVIVRQPGEMTKIIRKNPFIGRNGVNDKGLYITFLQQKVSAPLVKALGPMAAETNDEYEVLGTEIYLHCHAGYGKTLLNNSFFERELKVRATTRNWNTLNVLAEMARMVDGGSGDSRIKPVRPGRRGGSFVR